MYMDEKIYTLSQFRKCTREAFNLVDADCEVYIDRYGERYVLTGYKFYKFLIDGVEQEKVAPAQSPMFCKDGHPIPEGRSRCMGKGCKYS